MESVYLFLMKKIKCKYIVLYILDINEYSSKYLEKSYTYYNYLKNRTSDINLAISYNRKNLDSSDKIYENIRKFDMFIDEIYLMIDENLKRQIREIRYASPKQENYNNYEIYLKKIFDIAEIYMNEVYEIMIKTSIAKKRYKFLYPKKFI